MFIYEVNLIRKWISMGTNGYLTKGFFEEQNKIFYHYRGAQNDAQNYI